MIHATTRRILVAIALGMAAIVVLYALYTAFEVLLLLFAGVLLALFLDGAARALEAHSPLPHNVSLAVVILAILTLLVLFGWMVTPRLIRQTEQLRSSLSSSWEQIVNNLEQSGWGRQFLEEVRAIPGNVAQGPNIVTNITGIFSRTLDVVVNFAIFIFVGFFLALNPDTYRDGLVRLIPVPQRKQGRDLLSLLARTLRWWIIGRLASMTIVGVMTTLGLMLLDVPLAFILGFLASLLSFVPVVGPVVSVIPALLVAAGNSFEQVIFVLILYQAIQLVESYVLTPLIQERTVSLPPVVTIISQVLAGLVAGALGVALAQPLAAISMVLVKSLYVEGVLTDRSVQVDPTPS